MSSFTIGEFAFDTVDSMLFSDDELVKSCPHNYTITHAPSIKAIKHQIEKHPSPIVLIDRNVDHRYFNIEFYKEIPCYIVDAVEDNKNIETALDFLKLIRCFDTTKSSMVFVIGGGITQDIGAFACAMYKRGLPWTFIPTTLLAQMDSCVGGKTALNFQDTKNTLALFSAPRNVILCPSFLETLSSEDIFSGLGEAFRLCITGGDASLRFFESFLESYKANDDELSFNTLIFVALRIKKIVVEFDEFEHNTRRSMNYGHSIGHALEALSNYKIPHGIAVTMGILVENEIANTLPQAEKERIKSIGLSLIPPKMLELCQKIKPESFLPLLRNDKKTENDVLKLPALRSIGKMIFVDFVLDSYADMKIQEALKSIGGEHECSFN